MIAHHSSGLDVLPAPPSPEHAERVTGELIGRLVPALWARYRWIVVDTAPTFSDVNLSLLDHTDWLFHVTAPDVPALRSLQSALAVFARLGHSPGERCLVMNAIHARTRLDRGRIEQTLGTRIDLAVPYSEAVLDSLDRGVPLAVGAPADPGIQALDGWVRQVADVKAPTPVAEALGLTNVRLHQRDLRDGAAEFGEFEYIIAHGVYSWIPAAAQQQPPLQDATPG